MELQGGAFTSFISCQSTRVLCLVQPAIQNQHLPLFYWFPFVRLGDGCWWVCLCVASGLCMRVLCLMNYSAWLIGCWILLHMKGALAWHVPPLPLTLCTLWNLLPPPSLQLSFRLALLILSCADLLMQYKFDVCRLKTRYTLTVSETFPERRSPQKKDCWHQLLSAVQLVKDCVVYRMLNVIFLVAIWPGPPIYLGASTAVCIADMMWTPRRIPGPKNSWFLGSGSADYSGVLVMWIRAV